MDPTVAGLAAVCGVGGKFLFQPNHLGRRRIRAERKRRDGGSRQSRCEKECGKAAAGRLTEGRKAFNLNRQNRSCPEPGKVLRFVFVASVFVTPWCDPELSRTNVGRSSNWQDFRF